MQVKIPVENEANEDERGTNRAADSKLWIQPDGQQQASRQAPIRPGLGQPREFRGRHIAAEKGNVCNHGRAALWFRWTAYTIVPDTQAACTLMPPSRGVRGLEQATNVFLHSHRCQPRKKRDIRGSCGVRRVLQRECQSRPVAVPKRGQSWRKWTMGALIVLSSNNGAPAPSRRLSERLPPFSSLFFSPQARNITIGRGRRPRQASIRDECR